jgi:RNA polymerase sigma-70 factor, ECF subfamily
MVDIQTRLNLKHGDPSAYKKVFRLLYPRLKGYCKLFIINNADIEDIIQETFISLWEKREAINLSKSIENFVFVTVRNRCLNVLKSKKLHRKDVHIDDLNTSDLQYLYQLDFTEEEGGSLEEMLIESSRNVVDELPQKMKEVFILCKIEGKNQKEVADTLGISKKMVEKHISIAKEHIRKELTKQFPTLVAILSLLIK